MTNESIQVSDAPAIHSVLSAFLADGPSILANPQPLNPVVDEQFHALNAIFHSRAAEHDPSSLEGVSGLPPNLDPCAFAAGTDNNPDILSQSAMLHAHDCHQFVLAQQPEITGLEDADVFEYHPMGELQSLPVGTHLLNAIWSYCRKRKPNGDISKYKSRICVDGSQQQYGIDYWNTYAPVVQWSTVRLMLVLSTILGLASHQIDYVQAFPQATLDDPVYMRIPQGWYNDTTTSHFPQHTDFAIYDASHQKLLGMRFSSVIIPDWSFTRTSQPCQSSGYTYGQRSASNP